MCHREGASADWLAQYQGDIRWVVEEFGSSTASELELVSTAIYVDRELARQDQATTLEELTRLVREVKPHFTDGHVLARCKALQEKRFLLSVSEPGDRPR